MLVAHVSESLNQHLTKKSVNAHNAETKHTLVFVDHTVRQNKIIIENNLEHILR